MVDESESRMVFGRSTCYFFHGARAKDGASNWRWVRGGPAAAACNLQKSREMTATVKIHIDSSLREGFTGKRYTQGCEYCYYYCCSSLLKYSQDHYTYELCKPKQRKDVVEDTPLCICADKTFRKHFTKKWTAAAPD